MSVIDDVMKMLDRIPLWRRLQEVPSEVDELKTKVAALEAKLGGKWPADVCRFCGERAARLWYTIPRPNDQGVMIEDWKCQKCGKSDTRVFKPTAR